MKTDISKELRAVYQSVSPAKPTINYATMMNILNRLSPRISYLHVTHCIIFNLRRVP